jgi:polyvinyl alcohol dehydrogenase (cytochrome)
MAMRYLVAALLLLTTWMSACGGQDTEDPGATAAVTGGSDPAISEDRNWPMLARDIASTFHNPDEETVSRASVAGLAEVWTLNEQVNGTPAVVDGVVYVQSISGTFALEAETGEAIWQSPDIAGTSSPTYADGVVYVNDSGAVLHALDAERGDEIWQVEVDPHPFAQGFSSPVPAGDLLVVGNSSREEVSDTESATFRGGVIAYDRASGDEVWRYDTVQPPQNGASVWGTVSVDLEAGRVFAGTGNNYTGEASETSDAIFALDLATGELVWNTQLTEGDVFTIPNPQGPDFGFGTNPILFEAEVDGVERELLGAGQKSGDFWALDRETGDVVWNHQASGGSSLIGGVFNNGAYDGERIIIAGNNGTSDAPGSEPASGESEPLGAADTPTSVLKALQPATGEVVWERQLPAWVWAPITIANGVGFVSAESAFQAFDTATGEKLFELAAGGTISSGAAIADGRVYFGSGLSYFNTTPGETFRALEAHAINGGD